MTDAIRHRGPDSSGTWSDQSFPVGLGHRRLAILDLSPEGHQPMISRSGRFAIVFNGEVFNYGSIAERLRSRGHTFRGHSDTEVMLAAFEEWGVEDSVKKFIGMFAFALWDRDRSEVTLVRDRLGIKPLYYSWNAGRFYFASELKSFRAHSAFNARIDRNALAFFLRLGYIPSPLSIYEGVYKLTPGCILTLKRDELASMPSGFDPEGMLGFPSPQLRPFWSIRDVVLTAKQKPQYESESEAIADLEALLSDSVRLRMIADVPLGAFLSGGIDSSTVVALMQKQHTSAVRTFSIGFHTSDYDEAKHAAAVARHLGTDHTELYVGENELLDIVPRLPEFYDEPFADSSQIPTTLVSALARKHVTVALSGDGGDEIFGGYNRYVWPERVWKYLRYVPQPLRRGASALGSLAPMSFWKGVFSPLNGKFDKPHERAQKLLNILPAADLDSVYELLNAQWITPPDLVFGADRPLDMYRGKPRFLHLREFRERAMYLDQEVYLPDDNLHKVDRASMASALEVRVPLLDHRVVEFAARLPLHFKIRGGETKWILRQVLHRHVPREIIDRPKMGFSVPVGEWLKGPLRGWAEDLLNSGSLGAQGFIRPGPVRRLWEEHLGGSHNWQHQLWNVLMFQSWLERWKT